MKKILLLSIPVFLLLLSVSLYFYQNIFEPEQEQNRIEFLHENQFVAIHINSNTIKAEIARTPEEQKKGLSGRLNLEYGEGMLFVYDSPKKLRFWMPDMNFDLDIIWFDANLTVIDISKNVSKDSYPEIFSPMSPAQYALEVPALYTELHNIAIGDDANVSTL